MSLMIEEKNMKHMTTLSEIVSDVITSIRQDMNEMEPFSKSDLEESQSDLESMLEVMEDLKFNPFLTPTISITFCLISCCL